MIDLADPGVIWRAQARAEIILINHGVRSEAATFDEGPRDRADIEAIIADIQTGVPQ